MSTQSSASVHLLEQDPESQHVSDGNKIFDAETLLSKVITGLKSEQDLEKSILES